MADPKPSRQDERNQVEKRFSKLLREVFTTLDGIRASVEIVVPPLSGVLGDQLDQVKASIERFRVDGESHYRVPIAAHEDFLNLRRRQMVLSKPIQYFQEGLLILCFASIETFLREVREIVISLEPKYIHKLGITIEAKELIGITDVKAFLDEQVARKLDEKRFEALPDSFKSLFQFFDLVFDPCSVPEWNFVIETEQRRHLVVHTGGQVNEEYIEKCKAQSIPEPFMLSKGDTVSVDTTLLLQIASHVETLLCRTASYILGKVWPDYGLITSQRIMVNRMYQLLGEDRYLEAISIGELCSSKPYTDSKAPISEDGRQRIAVNLAQAYKWNNDRKKCNEILRQNDFSEAPETFQLAIMALNETYLDLANRLPDDRASGIWVEVERWPVYKEFRKSEAYAKRYEQIFGSSIIKEEGPAEEIASGMKPNGKSS